MNIATLKLTLLKAFSIKTVGKSDYEVMQLAQANGLITNDQLAAHVNAIPAAAEVEKFVNAPAPAPTPAPTPAPAPTAEILAQLVASLTPTANVDEARIVELIKEHTTPAPRELIVKNPEFAPVENNVGITHPAFDEAIEFINIGIDVFFYGETGSGKSTTARKIADALNRPFFSMGALMTKFETLGIKTPDGYSPSVIRKWLESDNGLLCIDEIDASNPNALTSVMALFDSNGEMTFPDGVTLQRSEKHQIVITGNTTGNGANAKYNSRMKLDDAFLTRFVRIEHGYDENVENYLGGIVIAEYARKFRALLVSKKLHGAIIAPRTILQAATVFNYQIAPNIKKRMLKTIFKQGLSVKDYQSIAVELDAII